ncbi:MAG: trypsin-like peptidase domain-containing protein [Bacilli bacterium]|nr:trypsin-like peptidase domain-containing protein [Bacilli bacterium]
MNKVGRIILGIVIGLIIGVLGMYALMLFTPVLDKLLPSSTIITKDKTKVVEKSSLAPSIKKIKNAVVAIEGYKSTQKGSTGTGFVYKVDDKYGYILTNQHVIANVDSIHLILTNDKVIEGKALGGDEYLDLAVIQVDKKDVLAIADLGTSEKSEIGDQVFTVGSPLGEEYRGSVTSGILSGKDRMVSVNVSNSTNSDWVMKVLQTDAAVNPGNSGGPLVNINGQVIGVISMKLSDEDIEGMGFAIPMETALAHLDALEKNKTIEWPVMGISMSNIDDAGAIYKYRLNIKKKPSYGALVAKVEKDGAADKAGLKSGDVIVAVDGQKVKNSAYLRYELYKHKIGDKVEVTYIRDGKEEKTKVTLEKE